MLEFDRSQLMRGSLEGCILKIISLRTTYGYEIIELLKESGFRDVSEGTIYPMLIRLEKQGSVSSKPLGPKRKYYTITEAGKWYLADFVKSWEEVAGAVDGIINGKAGGGK